MEDKNRNRNLIEGSTKTRALNSLYEWLTNTGHLKLTSRVSKGTPNQTVKAKFSGNKENRYNNLIHLGSYNYSGLNGHPDIIKAAEDTLKKYGTTTSGVRLLNGTTDLHVEFEQRLAQFLGFEDCLTYSSGYAANISVLTALCCDKDIVFSDALNHQSLHDGMKLSEAKIIKFPHRDYEALECALRNVSKVHRKFIVTDGIFSMDGDVANLKILVDLAEQYNAFIIVDDAHATGAYGPNGRGTPSYFKIESQIDVLTGSLSKGLPGIGGFAAGSSETINLLRYGSNGYIFSASIPAPTIAALITAIDILEKNPQLQVKLHHNECLLREGINDIGLNVMHSETPIIPILLPNRDVTFNFAKRLHELGVYANPICFPAVSRNCPRLRLNASAALSIEDIKYTLDIIRKTAYELNVIAEELVV